MKRTKLGLIILGLVLLILVSSRFFSGPFKLSETFSFSFINEDLKKIVDKNLENKKGKYAVYIEELKDGEDVERYSLNGSEVFPAASLYKVYLMAAVLKEVDPTVIPAKAGIYINNDLNGSRIKSGMTNAGDDKNQLTLETTLSVSKSHLIEVLGDREYGINDLPNTLELSVDEALARVGRISDNFSSLMLAEKVGWEKVQEMADALGAKNTKVYPPAGGLIETSAQDLGLFFKKLHRKEIVSPAVSEGIIKYLSLNQINDRIPKGGGKVIHKTGELARVRHDGGLVCLDSEVSCYVIVLLSKDLEFEDGGVETLANISKDVYEYFKNK